MFVVFEGLDRSGKSTQCAILAGRLGCASYRFPDRSTPSGLLIDAQLRSGARPAPELFAANRREAVPEMRARLVRGERIVVDRWSYSGEAYSGEEQPETLRPDLVLFLDIDPEQAARRDGYGFEAFETLEQQQSIRDRYHRIGARNADIWRTVDASGPIDQVAQLVWSFFNDVDVQCSRAGTEGRSRGGDSATAG